MLNRGCDKELWQRSLLSLSSTFDTLTFSFIHVVVAVVGAGIGGTATAHFLRQHFGPEVRIDVFEKGTVGGRLATVTVNHHDYESGGSIIHSLNLHMQDFVKQLGKVISSVT